MLNFELVALGHNRPDGVLPKLVDKSCAIRFKQSNARCQAVLQLLPNKINQRFLGRCEVSPLQIVVSRQVINFELGIFDKVLHDLLNGCTSFADVELLLDSYFCCELFQLVPDLLRLSTNLFELRYAKFRLCSSAVVDELLVKLLLRLIFLSGEVESTCQLIEQALVTVLLCRQRTYLVLQLDGELLTLLQFALVRLRCIYLNVY